MECANLVQPAMEHDPKNHLQILHNKNKGIEIVDVL